MTTTTETISATKPRISSASAFNKAQTHEKEEFLKLLHALCKTAQEPVIQTNGRPRLPIEDAIFAICYKIYSTMSARRFMSDLRDAQAKGFIQKTPHFNSIFNYLDRPELTPVLHDMIEQSSLALSSVENDFAADSSGFTASQCYRWQDHKYGQRKKHDWVKVHIMCGVKTHIITSAEIRERHTSDTEMLPDLVAATAKNFTMNEVSADKAYGSYKNYAAIEAAGATPFIAFKTQHTGKGMHVHAPRGGSALWTKMYHYFQFNREEYMAHYHKRSNVETTFSMIKAKFGGSVRGKIETSRKNEVLCKIICHNICVLIQEMYELDVWPVFRVQ